MSRPFTELRNAMSPDSQARAEEMTQKMLHDIGRRAPIFNDCNWTTVGTCGDCAGPVKTPIMWDVNGTYSGSPWPQNCAFCGKEPKVHVDVSYGPILEMKP